MAYERKRRRNRKATSSYAYGDESTRNANSLELSTGETQDMSNFCA